MSDSPSLDDVTTWQELVAAPAGDLIARLAEAARRHDVMVSITISPYESSVAEE